MRVAIVAACPFPVPRGTPVRILRLAEALAGLGHEIHVVTYHLGERIDDAPFQIHRIRRVPTYQKLSPGPSYQKLLLLDPLLRRLLVSVIREHDIEVVHAHHYEGLLTASTLPKTVQRPLVYDAHTMLESELGFYRVGLPQELKRAVGRWLDRRLPKAADHIVSVTETIRTSLVNHGFESSRVSVIPNGVEAEKFAMPEVEASADTGSGTVVFAGNLAAYQGIQFLLEAFREVAQAREDAELHIVSTSSFDPYEPLATSLGIRDRIKLSPGGFEELPGHLNRAAVAVSPRTICDGLPVKVLNYMAAARPTVAFAGSAKTLENGRTGLVVEDEDTTAMAEAILRLLQDPSLARRLGDNARQKVMLDYTWETMARRVESLYSQLIAQ